jgi:hypothetical protein
VRVTAAQIDLIGVPWLMIGEDPSSAHSGGSRMRAGIHDL